METRLAAPYPTDAASYRLISGVILAVVGVFAVVLSAFTSLVTVVGVGLLLMTGGAALLVDALRGSHRRRWLWGLCSVVPLVAGAVILAAPRAGIRLLTPVLLGLFVLDGTFLAVTAWRRRMPLWGLQLAAGVIEVALGVLLALRGFHPGLAGTLLGPLLVSRGLGLTVAAVQARRALKTG